MVHQPPRALAMIGLLAAVLIVWPVIAQGLGAAPALAATSPLPAATRTVKSPIATAHAYPADGDPRSAHGHAHRSDLDTGPAHANPFAADCDSHRAHGHQRSRRNSAGLSYRPHRRDALLYRPRVCRFAIGDCIH